jgi:PTH1 family peptidyl-tRNA hydrolase
MAVDRLADRYRMTLASEKFDASFDTGRVAGEMVALIKPNTFMNRSGKPVVAAAGFYDLSPDQIIVIHDDIDLELGTVRVKRGGGHGGHNGLRDIVAKMGNSDFIRVRLGVGRPEHGDVTNHVLGTFAQDDQDEVAELVESACDATETILQEGVTSAQNRFNG